MTELSPLALNETEEDIGEVVQDLEHLEQREMVSCLDKDKRISYGLSVQQHTDNEENLSECNHVFSVTAEIKDKQQDPYQSKKTVSQNITKSKKSADKMSVTIKRPTYKVYKQRHPFFRKLARYSGDLLRRDLPDYSLSLYLSL